MLEEIVRIKDSAAHVPRPDDGTWQSAGAIILGNKFSLAWRVLDAQYWGVAQRRRRIFLVADFAGACAPEILFKQDSLFGNFAESEDARQGTASAAQGGFVDTGGTCLTSQDKRNNDGFVKTEEKAAVAFAANQRDEVRNLHDIAGALGAQPGMKQQTFVAETTCLNGWDTQQSRIFMPEGVAPTLAGADGGGGRNPAGLLFAAGFCAGAGPSAGGIGYSEEVSPTLKSSESGTNMVPSVLCLNDQGGKQMHCTEDYTGTLRSQEHGHQPLIKLVFFMIKPTNINVLSDTSISARIYALMNVLKGIAEIEMLCLNSRENFEDNKSFLRQRTEAEQNPTIRKLLQQDMSNLDRMQVQMATAREFLIIIRLREEKESDILPYLSRIEKSLKDQGFTVRRADEADFKRLLGVYYEQNVTTEKFEDFDGERWVILGE